MSNNKKDSLEDKIKELAKDMGIGFQLSGTTRFGPVAAELVEMGYQRIKKDDIIISKEDNTDDYKLYGHMLETKQASIIECDRLSNILQGVKAEGVKNV